jgi:transcriptional regulator with XRE-family HTH domain
VRLGEKLTHLREVEGQVRGLRRPLTKAEVVRLMREELGTAVSHAYLSQLENGHRIHLSAHTRELLARFFGVHPGYLVGDLEDDEVQGYASFGPGDPPSAGPVGRRADGPDHRLLKRVLTKLSNVEEPERYLALFERLLDLPAETTEAAVRQQTRAALLEAAQRVAGAETAAER